MMQQDFALVASCFSWCAVCAQPEPDSRCRRDSKRPAIWRAVLARLKLMGQWETSQNSDILVVISFTRSNWHLVIWWMNGPKKCILQVQWSIASFAMRTARFSRLRLNQFLTEPVLLGYTISHLCVFTATGTITAEERPSYVGIGRCRPSCLSPSFMLALFPLCVYVLYKMHWNLIR